ncbi:hypothetical protein D3C85_1272440 [compost metagenome]
MGNHRDLLAVRPSEYLGSYQQVSAQQRHGIYIDPTIGIGQLRHWLLVQHRNLSAIERQQVFGFG